MNKQQVLKILETIIHPDLEKNIVELKLIDSLHVSEKSLHVKIDTDNKNAFNFIARAIPKLFKDYFRNIEVEKNIKETNNRAPDARKVIAISSGKGGVGKSTVSANLAIALAEEGYKVGLFDANVYGTIISYIFDFKNEKLLLNENNQILPFEKFGVKVMSADLTSPSSVTHLVSTPIQFLENVEWGELDFLIVDMPSGNNAIQISITEELPLSGTILITTPQTQACDDVSRVVMMFKDLHVKILGVVENMSYFITPDTNKRYDIFGKDGGKIICEKYGLNLLSQIPITLGNENIKENYRKVVKKVLEEV